MNTPYFAQASLGYGIAATRQTPFMIFGARPLWQIQNLVNTGKILLVWAQFIALFFFLS